MNKKMIWIILSLGLAVHFGITGQTVTIQPGTTYQVHEGFGTSLCWFGNVIGGFPDTAKNDIADLLFDQEYGIGINVVRYNIGGGDNPSHDHMRAGAELEGFQPSQGNWDWNADTTQRWMLQAAKNRVPAGDFVAEAFSNSPPYWMTNSNCSAGASGGADNLNTSYLNTFADYLTEVVRHFRDYWGINFKTLEPMNEPGGGWTVNGGQEGCHMNSSIQNNLIKAVYSSLTSKGLSNVIISAPDGMNVSNTISHYNGYDSTTRSYVGQINTHGYAGSASECSSLRNTAQNAGKELWQSECDSGGARGDVWGEYTFNPDDIIPALTLSEQIYFYLKELRPKSWVFWQAVENWPNMIDENRNWGLMLANLESSGRNGVAYQEYRTTKKYYAFGQYSKFIRPGFQQIGIDNSQAVAFINWDTGQVVIVHTNHNSGSSSVTYNLSQFNTVGSSVEVYRTSASQNLARLADINVSNKQFSTSLPGYSVTTFLVSTPDSSATPTPPPVMAGDVNDDGMVTIVDALMTAQCYVGLITCPSAAASDVNCSGSTDIVDALMIAQYYVGLISSLGC